MTFNPVAALNVIECKNIISTNDPKAVDLGSQTSSINDIFIKNLLDNNKTIHRIQKKNLDNLSRFKSFNTEDYFKSVGFKEYKSIDINGAYNSLQFDLNKNISATYSYNEKYDLVINNGTGEHVFNQYALFLNFHNLTKLNGIMLNILPFIDWINHGFYNFNPIFFADLAASNNYEIVKISLANRDGAELKLNNENLSILFEQIKPNRNDSKFKKMIDIAKTKLGRNILLVVITRKLSDNEFKIPLQGKYLNDVSNLESVIEASLESNFDSSSSDSNYKKGIF